MLPYSKHAAIITIEVDGHTENGEWVEGSKQEFTIKGRYVPGNNGNQMIKNRDGNEVIYRGRFITSSSINEDATKLFVKSKGIEATIVNWYPYDTHSVIYI